MADCRVDDGNGTSSQAAQLANEERLGVLFVHGMGEQKKGDTLIGPGEPILRFLNNWYDYETGHDPVNCATAMLDSQVIRIDDPDLDAPAHTTISFNHENQESGLLPTGGKRMLFAESWWAEDFRLASFLDVLKWGIFSAPFALADTIYYQHSRPGLWVNLQGPLTSLFGPVVQLLLLLMLPIAMLPIFQNFTGSFMLRIGNVLGDPYLLLSSQMRLSSMVERIHHDIRWLRAQCCKDVVIIAHSNLPSTIHSSRITMSGIGTPSSTITLRTRGTPSSSSGPSAGACWKMPAISSPTAMGGTTWMTRPPQSRRGSPRSSGTSSAICLSFPGLDQH